MSPRLPKYCTFVHGNDCGGEIIPGHRESGSDERSEGPFSVILFGQHLRRKVRQSPQATTEWTDNTRVRSLTHSVNCPVLNTRKHKKGTTKISSINNLPHCTRTKTEVKKKKERDYCICCVDRKRKTTNRVELIKFCSINSSNKVTNNEKSYELSISPVERRGVFLPSII